MCFQMFSNGRQMDAVHLECFQMDGMFSNGLLEVNPTFDPFGRFLMDFCPFRLSVWIDVSQWLNTLADRPG